MKPFLKSIVVGSLLLAIGHSAQAQYTQHQDIEVVYNSMTSRVYRIDFSNSTSVATWLIKTNSSGGLSLVINLTGGGGGGSSSIATNNVNGLVDSNNTAHAWLNAGSAGALYAPIGVTNVNLAPYLLGSWSNTANAIFAPIGVTNLNLAPYLLGSWTNTANSIFAPSAVTNVSLAPYLLGTWSNTANAAFAPISVTNVSLAPYLLGAWTNTANLMI